MKRFSEEELKRIQYEDIVEHPFCNASTLHMGVCNIFAKALHDIYGYELCHIDYDKSFHDFCRTIANGQMVYIDVSGVSTDLRDLQPGRNVDEEKIIGNWTVELKDEFDWTAYDFAVHMIQKYNDYYEIR